MHPAHDALWKGVLTTSMGFGAATFGFAGKILFASTALAPARAFMVPDGIISVSMADISALIGSVMTLGGGIWTWFLLQKSKAHEMEREQRKKEEDAARESRVENRMAEIRIMVAEAVARIQIKHEEMAVQVQQIAAAVPEQPKS